MSTTICNFTHVDVCFEKIWLASGQVIGWKRDPFKGPDRKIFVEELAVQRSLDNSDSEIARCAIHRLNNSYWILAVSGTHAESFQKAIIMKMNRFIDLFPDDEFHKVFSSKSHYTQMCEDSLDSVVTIVHEYLSRYLEPQDREPSEAENEAH